MKNFIKNIVIFSCFLGVFYVVSVVLWGQYFSFIPGSNLNYRIASAGFLKSRIIDLKCQAPVDILFLGSSHSARGFDTRIFEKQGFKAFNLGSSAQTAVQAELLLKRYIKKLRPKLIIYEVYPLILSMDGVESAVDIIANDRNDFNSLKMAFIINNIKVYNTLIFGLFRDLLDLNRNVTEGRRKKNAVYIKGGFVEWDLRSFSGDPKYEARKWEFKGYQLKAFERILKSLEKDKIPIILVQAPATKKLYNSYSNNKEVDSYYNSKGIYFNFNEILGLSSCEYFYDEHH